MSERLKGDWMIIGIGNIGSNSLKTKIIDINNENEVRVLGEANVDKIKNRGRSILPTVLVIKKLPVNQ